jgi:hypothetical protein
LAPDDAGDDPKILHYEGGLPVFDTKLNEIQREQREAKKRDEHYKDEQLNLDRKMVKFTRLLVFCAMVGGGISIWQATIAQRSANAAKSAAKTAADTLKEIRQSGTDTHALAEAAGKQATNTEKLANAAKSTADSARDTLITSQAQFRIQERPWVTADPFPLFPKEQVGGQFYLPKDTGKEIRYQPNINIQAVNQGKTPAVEMWSAQFELKIGPSKEITEEVKRFVPTFHRGGGGFLSPNQSLVMPIKERFLSAEEVAKVNDGSWDLYVVGGFQYRDVFKPRLPFPYETVYCFNIHRIGLPVATCSFTNTIK